MAGLDEAAAFIGEQIERLRTAFEAVTGREYQSGSAPATKRRGRRKGSKNATKGAKRGPKPGVKRGPRKKAGRKRGPRAKKTATTTGTPGVSSARGTEGA